MTKQGPVVKYTDGNTETIPTADLDRIEVAPESVAKIDIAAHTPPAPKATKKAVGDLDVGDQVRIGTGKETWTVTKRSIDPIDKSVIVDVKSPTGAVRKAFPISFPNGQKWEGKHSYQHVPGGTAPAAPAAPAAQKAGAKDPSNGPAALDDLKAAYKQAQKDTDKSLGYSNPNAPTIVEKAIDSAIAKLGDNYTLADLVNSTFHGRLRGNVVKRLKELGYTLPKAPVQASGAIDLAELRARVHGR